MKKLLIGVVIIAIIIGGLIMARNIIVKAAIVKGIKAATGLSVDIKDINIGLASPGILVSGLKIYNPEGFTDNLLADIPELSVNLDLPGLFTGRVHLRKLLIDIKELDVIMSENGKLNVNSLALLMPKPGGGKPPEVKIDELQLKIGKVSSKGYLPLVGGMAQELNVGIDETFHNVTDPSKVAGEVVKKILNRVGISGLTGLDIKTQVSEVKNEAQQAVGEVVQKAKEDLKSIFSY
jgi:hypothetical protein